MPSDRLKSQLESLQQTLNESNSPLSSEEHEALQALATSPRVPKACAAAMVGSVTAWTCKPHETSPRLPFTPPRWCGRPPGQREAAAALPAVAARGVC